MNSGKNELYKKGLKQGLKITTIYKTESTVKLNWVDFIFKPKGREVRASDLKKGKSSRVLPCPRKLIDEYIDSAKT